jgi:hypothetical protein
VGDDVVTVPDSTVSFPTGSRYAWHRAVMPYEFVDEARTEAGKHAPDESTLAKLADRVGAAAAAGGVRDHRVRFVPTAWGAAVMDRLPAHTVADAMISRSDVFDIADQVREGSRPAADLFTASFVWGTGTTGHGPERHRMIVAAAGNQLEPALQTALEAGRQDVIAGYTTLYGGHGPRARAGALQPPWMRLPRYGPASFTKLLYFALPDAMILDSVLAAAVRQLSGIGHLVAADGRLVAWPPYRYAVYLAWMHQIAQRLKVDADLLELALSVH